MKVSIALATYNGAAFLRDQLDSFVRQTKHPDELVVSDDASTDETPDILRAFAQEAPFPVHVHLSDRNLGFSRNFEKAIQKCSGDIIFLSDQDDVWFPDKIEIMMEAIESAPDVWVLIHDTVLTDSELNASGRSKIDQLEALGLEFDEYVTGCCTAFRAQILPLLAPIPSPAFTHDVWLHRLADLLGLKRVLPMTLQYQRRHDDVASEWIANRVENVGFLDLLRTYAPRDPRSGCRRKLARLQELETRLKSRREFVFQLPEGKNRLRDALRRLEEATGAVTRRLRLLERHRGRRLVPATRLFLSGGYEQFSGWKSYVKDLIKS